MVVLVIFEWCDVDFDGCVGAVDVECVACGLWDDEAAVLVDLDGGGSCFAVFWCWLVVGHHPRISIACL